MANDELIRFKHILDAAEEALSFVKDKSKADLTKDHTLVLSLVKEIEIIGEAASKISDKTKTKDFRVPWIDITGMRNHLIHAYFHITTLNYFKLGTKGSPLFLLLKLILFTKKQDTISVSNKYRSSCVASSGNMVKYPIKFSMHPYFISVLPRHVAEFSYGFTLHSRSTGVSAHPLFVW